MPPEMFRHATVWFVGLCAWGGALTVAQDVDEPDDPPAVVEPAFSPRPRVWLHFDYLMVRIKAGPLPAPVLTVNDDPTSIAALNEPGTRVLVGGDSGRDFDFDYLNGLRFTAGAWLDSDGRFGAEVSGFQVGPRGAGYSARADGTGPVLAIPVNAASPFGANPAGETSLNPGGSASIARVDSSVEAWGGELNALLFPTSDDDFTLGYLIGGRYFGMQETFDLVDRFYDAANTGMVTVRDSFQTRNQFAGVNLGGSAQWASGRWAAALTGKLAVGVVRQCLDIRGATVVNGAPFGMADTVFPGGVFSQPSNIGHHSRDTFGVLPEANMRVAFTVTQNLKVSVGYEAMYLNSVLRPGDQIDRTVNVNQSMLFGGGAGGPARPAAPMTDSGLWMHGVSFGVGWTY